MASMYDGIIKRYQLATGDTQLVSRKMAAWAIASGLWEQPRFAPEKQLARELSRAMREEYITDARGKRVRAKHNVTRRINGVQTTMWEDIRYSKRPHMELSLHQRRERIVGDCRQLKVDLDSYNATHPAEEPIQIVFNFINDLLELEAASAA